MASAWGSSFGTAWLDSWAAREVSTATRGGIVQGRRGRPSWFARVLRVRDLDDDEAVEAAIERAIVKPMPKRRRVIRSAGGPLQPALAPVAVERIDWDVVERIRHNAEVEHRVDFAAILERVIQRMRAEEDQDDEDALRWLM